MDELISLEKEYPYLVMQSSPTQKVGSFSSTKFEKVVHETKMLSLQNAFNKNDLDNFIKNVEEFNVNRFCVEPKIDGLSISLIYENGKLKRAITRGDGFVGEDVTENVMQIKSIPHEIANLGKLIIRGEIFLPIENFIKINKDRTEKGEKIFANPRNAASGTIRQLDKNVVKERELDAFFYQLISESYVKTQYDSIETLNDLGFKTNELTSVVDADSVFDRVETIFGLRQDLDYEIDGVVIKVNEIDKHGEIGYTNKFPK